MSNQKKRLTAYLIRQRKARNSRRYYAAPVWINAQKAVQTCIDVEKYGRAIRFDFAAMRPKSNPHITPLSIDHVMSMMKAVSGDNIRF